MKHELNKDSDSLEFDLSNTYLKVIIQYLEPEILNEKVTTIF